ncbi:hypothetical protein MKCMC460_56660 [Mycobacterium sp. 20KCMC460]|uniref:Uncharacterized protein n=1 Tax=Mycobacterium kiyosense TaxID=2871094 RepID=A0AA37PTV4_9MYCO|nr:hypothetical protein IWGMT90018_57880 [Mycobacterium kiyosense]BDE16806.1 hypothetical protein MKCMC460_56660 [Mycobacterium sp. 20KCMC460]GLB83110.1 hypothetical protein SRL2020028_23660 [Mycobacterium kiyosense]GLB90716.1 hypothetical protein SRL2020130_35330 [Mycobacterium kiyosense]GLB97748.1 hypothetical protein SRL2020226_45240 [Mycobacterium kiyosense]
MVASTDSTFSGAARVPTPTGPIGQSELSMSIVCCARSPGGVVVSIRCPTSAALADGVGDVAHPGASANTSTAAALDARTRVRR